MTSSWFRSIPRTYPGISWRCNIGTLCRLSVALSPCLWMSSETILDSFSTYILIITTFQNIIFNCFDYKSIAFNKHSKCRKCFAIYCLLLVFFFERNANGFLQYWKTFLGKHCTTNSLTFNSNDVPKTGSNTLDMIKEYWPVYLNFIFILLINWFRENFVNKIINRKGYP